jgi:nitrite reductase (NADH) small subunit/3-phenylpropionate/trans-cinnamate dioxygenase ferredoxin subunit
MPLACAMESSELGEGVPRRCELAGQAILLLRVEGVPYAVQDRCPHRGASLSDSPVAGAVVTCHAHFWSFDVRSGASLQVPGLDLKTYRVVEEGGRIHVEV